MSIVGAIKVIDTPEDACLTTVRELILSLEKYLAVEIDASQITNVIVSSEEPDTTDRNILWFKINNSGNFVGILVYVQGQWTQMFPLTGGLYRMIGNSNDIPKGYALADSAISWISEETANWLQDRWKPGPEGSDYWTVFDVVYVGL